MTTRPSTRPARVPAEARGPLPETPWRRLSGPVVALALAVGLVVVTSSVVRGGAALRLDDLVRASTPGRGNGPAVPDLLALGVVELATPALSVAVLSALTMALCLRTGRWAPLLLAAPAVVLMSSAVLLGKGLISRTAPDVPGMLGGDGSYPSGHTATALVCAGVAAELVARLHPRRRTPARAAAALWTLLVAVSLLWLHFHWLSDVVGSILLGSLVLWLLLRWPWVLGAGVGTQCLHEGRSRAR